MTKNQFYLLIYSLLFTSTIFAISRTNWLFIWISIELNLLCFIPIIYSSHTFQETEARVKYFLNQALGSRLLLITRSMLRFNFTYSTISLIVLIASLSLKLGIAPFHLWFPSVMSSISWINCFILSTWQKLAPLAYISTIISLSLTYIIIILSIISAILGGIIGVNQTKLRTIIAYSSITHLGWITGLILVKPLLSLVYFIIYSIIIYPLFILINKNKLNLISQTTVSIKHSPLIQALIPLILLSLRGIPPITGFMPKWISIIYLSQFNTTLLLLLIIGSLISTYYYLSIIFSALLNFNLEAKQNSIKLFTYPSQYASILATASLLILPFTLLLYALNIFYKPQRHWHTIFPSWYLGRYVRSRHKSPYSNWIKTTRIIPRKRPVI